MFIGIEINRSIILTIFSILAIWKGGIYDLTDYVNTVTLNQGATNLYQFLSTDVSDVFKQQAGQDITKPLNMADANTAAANVNCLKNMFYLGETDFRNTPRCLDQNYMLLVFASIMCASIELKCMYLLLVCLPAINHVPRQSFLRFNWVQNGRLRCRTSSSSVRSLATRRTKILHGGLLIPWHRCYMMTSGNYCHM
jgi:hypothetical protein